MALTQGGRCTERCRSCGYCYIGLDMALCRSMPMCEYLLQTGRRRPCPAGDGCTAFRPAEEGGERRRRAAERMWGAVSRGRQGVRRRDGQPRADRALSEVPLSRALLHGAAL